MLGVSDISREGRVVGTLTTPKEPGDIVTFDAKSPAAIKQLTERQRGRPRAARRSAT